MIDEITLLENQKQIKVKTSINSWSNIFAAVRLNLTQDKNAVFHEYTFDIKDALFSEKDKPEQYMMRLEINGKKFYAHRNRTKVIN